MSNQSVESVMTEIRNRLALMEQSLPARLDAMAVSETARIPFKALWYRESLFWRMAELGRSAFEHFETDTLASAVLLTRAALETSAAVWYFRAKVAAVVESGIMGDIHDSLRQLIMGSKSNQQLPEAFNVLKFVDRATKDIEGFRQQYESLCEFAHPNWAGTVLMYSKPGPEYRSMDFGANVRGKSARVSGVMNLSVALWMFEISYHQLSDLMPRFIALCERELGPGDSETAGA
jgi:hypothetical protein